MNRSLIGPTLPSDWDKPRDDANNDAFGPSLPPNFRDSSSDATKNVLIASNDSETDINEQFIGPLPPSLADSRYTDAQTRSKTDTKQKQQREEWMTVVPKKLAKKLSMKSVTSFSRKAVTTSDEHIDTTNDAIDHKRDNHMNQLMKSYDDKNKRKVSLLEQHSESKKKKACAQTGERVPFDPQTDLAVRCLDARQSRSVIDKAKLLNTRFTKGKTKFL